ncbi:MAG: hypothetical protein ACFFKA_00635 [Candidatus Thorarchaeota archaeon]
MSRRRRLREEKRRSVFNKALKEAQELYRQAMAEQESATIEEDNTPAEQEVTEQILAGSEVNKE